MAVSTGARRHCNYDVTVISMDIHVSYSQCGIPYALAGEIDHFDQLLVRKPEFFEDIGINIKLNTKVNTINLIERNVNFENEIMQYDKLVIATGSKPNIPENLKSEKSLKNVFTLRTYNDGILINEALKTAKSIVIIGAGPIGVEVAIAAAKRGVKTHLLNRSNTILSSVFDPDMAEILISYLKKEGIEVITGQNHISIRGNLKVDNVQTDGIKISTDVVLIAAGVTSSIALAKDAGIDIGPSTGIITNKFLQVISNNKVIEDVFAGGECTQIYNFITDKPMVTNLASTSRRMANIIVNNLCNSNKKAFKPVTNPWVASIGELQIASVGITTKEAEKNGMKVISGLGIGNNKAGYFPNTEKVYIKLIFHDRVIVGSQIISKTGAKERIDNMSLAIKNKCTVEEMLEIETSYSPSVGTLEDPLLFAVKGAYKKMKN